MALSGKATKQTSLDLYSRPSMRLARKEAEAKGPRLQRNSHRDAGPGDTAPAKSKSKPKVVGARGTPRTSESSHPEDNESEASQATGSEAEADNLGTSQDSKCMIRSVEEGRLYLEEEALLDLGEHINLDVMAGTLVQLSMMDILVLVSLAVRAVALILAQVKLESISY